MAVERPTRSRPASTAILRGDRERNAAIQAYQHAAQVQNTPAHGGNVIGEPQEEHSRPHPSPLLDPTGTIRHDLASPTSTAFKVGFGLSVGVLSLRGIVFLVVGALLLLATLRLLEFLTG